MVHGLAMSLFGEWWLMGHSVRLQCGCNSPLKSPYVVGSLKIIIVILKLHMLFMIQK